MGKTEKTKDTKQNKTEINKSNHKFRRDLYDLVKRHPTTYFVLYLLYIL